MVGAQVAVGVGVKQQCQMLTKMDRPTATIARRGPIQLDRPVSGIEEGLCATGGDGCLTQGASKVAVSVTR